MLMSIAMHILTEHSIDKLQPDVNHCLKQLGMRELSDYEYACLVSHQIGDYADPALCRFKSIPSVIDIPHSADEAQRHVRQIAPEIMSI